METASTQTSVGQRCGPWPQALSWRVNSSGRGAPESHRWCPRIIPAHHLSLFTAVLGGHYGCMIANCIWPCVSNYPVVMLPGHHEHRHGASAEQWGGSGGSEHMYFPCFSSSATPRLSLSHMLCPRRGLRM